MKTMKIMLIALVAVTAVACVTDVACGQTALGEIEGRAAPVARRKCISGVQAGMLCNEDTDCPASTCIDRNVFNITVAVHFNADASEIADIETMVSNMSEALYDITDGQAEIGQATIFNNAFTGGNDADVRIYDSTSPTWWGAETGGWKTGGSIHVSINYVQSAVGSGTAGLILCHEFVHLVFDARDEYESRAAGCGAVVGSADCPDSATQSSLGEEPCLMDANFSELCWGQGNPGNLTDISGGNHDATNVTEQSRCRSNRSCWDQVVWSWPETMLMPTGAPDPGTGGGTVNPTNYIQVDETMRAVLVLDESGSMNNESPTRLSRLKVAALDFVQMAENDTEVGVVSYSSDADPSNGHANVAIAALGTNRTTWINAINGLSASGATNIGDGLQRARDMIMAAGGVTSRTAIILMTDGINNEPGTTAQAQADLDAKLAMLSSDGIPVYVTCTGTDLGLSSQCAEIATATGGFYVDSADAAQLPETFADFHEKLQNHEGIFSRKGIVAEIKPAEFLVEEGVHSLTIAMTWSSPKGYVSMLVIDPKGNQYQPQSMTQGLFLRIAKPVAGDWKIEMEPSGDRASTYVLRAYGKSRLAQLRGTTSKPTYLPGEAMTVFAYPRFSGPISSFEADIRGTVKFPNGEMASVVLSDKGRVFPGDDVDDDGIFAGIFENTQQKGVYQFHLKARFIEWHRSSDSNKPQPDINIPVFSREVRFSAAVAEPGDIYTNPDDPKDADLGDAPDSTNHIGVNMTAYPDGTLARYPTVFNGPQPLGPKHWNPRKTAFLGKSVSVEHEADIGFDQDPQNNILPRADIPDQDRDDDPLNLLELPCGSDHSLFFLVTVVNPAEVLWVNIWYDFNRDGDWNDWSLEKNPQWNEWAVRNQALIGLPVGTHVIESNKFFSDHPTGMDLKEPDPIWMRITLSDIPWRGGRWAGWSGAGGSGPPNGYIAGETEDFVFVPKIPCKRDVDVNCDKEVNLRDLAIMADEWLR